MALNELAAKLREEGDRLNAIADCLDAEAASLIVPGQWEAMKMAHLGQAMRAQEVAAVHVSNIMAELGGYYQRRAELERGGKGTCR